MHGAGGEGEAGRPRPGIRQLEGKTKPAVSAQRWAACVRVLGHGNENHRFWSPRASPQGYRVKISLFGQIGQNFHYFENLAIFWIFFQDNHIMFVLKITTIA